MKRNGLKKIMENGEFNKVTEKYPLKINDYFLKLIKEKDDVIWKQCMPDRREMDENGYEDPLEENKYSPVKSLVHRYSDRALLLVTNNCPMFCRFCTRKRFVGNPKHLISKKEIEEAIDYIKRNKEISDVIISGGDPFILSDSMIESILRDLKSIEHVKIIRINTKTPCSLPERITQNLCNILKKYSPIFINTHFNHPSEITEESKKACEMLADSGIPLGNQMVLLRGVNDNIEVVKDLLYGLISMRVKPYYIYLPDNVKGTSHFSVPIKKALDIQKAIENSISGILLPRFVVDLPEGGGKVYLYYDSIKQINQNTYIFKNFEGKEIVYVDKQD